MENGGDGAQAVDVQFVKYIIEQQQGRFAAQALQHLVLGKLEGGDKGLLLALGAKMLDAMPIDGKGEILPVGAGTGTLGKPVLLTRGLEAFFPLSLRVLYQFGFEIDFWDFLVAHDEVEVLEEDGFEVAEELAPGLVDDTSILDEVVVPKEELLLVPGLAFHEQAEEGVALVQCFLITEQCLQIAAVVLADESIHEFTPYRRRSMDELGVVGENGDNGNGANVITHPFDRLAVDEHGLAFGRHIRTLYPQSVFTFQKPTIDGKIGHPLHQSIGFSPALESPGHGQVVQGFEDIGLTLAIVASQSIDAGREIRVKVSVVAKLGEFERGEIHLAKITDK